MDYGHRESDRRLAELERRIDKEYRQAYTEIEAKADKFFEKFRDEDKKLSQKVKQGEINKSDYIEWRKKAMIRGNALKGLEKTLAQDLVNADKIAGQMISGHKVDIYALNRNYGEYEIENALNIDLGFSLYDHKSVEKLIKDQPALLPTQLDKTRDLKWNRQKVSSAITQGILQGESIPNIGKRLRKVVGMDRSASIRNARTATTGAENAGRVDSYEEAESKGVELEKKWVAMLDQRTRSEHRQLDGQTCPIHDKFKVDGEEIGYPGDPTAAGYLVYNCRCTLVAEVKGIEYKDVRRSRLPEGMTYEEWKGKKDRSPAELPKEEKREIFKLKENNFVPAKTISEAEKYAKNKFTDGGFNLTGKEVSFKGIDVNIANRINQRLNDLYEQFNLPKLSSLESYGKANKRAWNSNPNAPMFTTNFGNFGLNNTLLKNEKAIGQYIKEGNDSFRFVMENINSLSGTKREIAEAYRIAGKSLVGDSVEDMVTHEIGHHLSYIPKTNKELSKIQSNTNWRETARHLSGYANHSFGEYVAESFNAYCRGESKSLQPEMVKVFESLRKK